MATEQRIKEEVRQRYTEAVQDGSGCCSKTGCCGGSEEETLLPPDRVVCSAGYRTDELKTLPADAVANSFGCGNPVAFAHVLPGETVVDIGSGAGIDCLLAAQRVGPAGHVIGIDMTPLMIEKARANAVKGGFQNVEFRMGEAEAMPVENNTADWIVSNCVINLSPNKPAVFREAFRVLRSGGQLSISDIMVEKLPWILRRSTALYTSCVAGAIPESEYVEGLRKAGFENVQVTERIVYDRDHLISLLKESRILRNGGSLLQRIIMLIVDRYIAGNVWSARISATKP